MRLIDANTLDITTIETSDYDGNEVLDVILKEDIDDAPTVFELPDNPTNGDMIKAMFPTLSFNAILSKMYASCGQGLLEWWNAPYERS